jgi:hypothetical protein
MAKRPRIERTEYRAVEQKDGSFAVEVSKPRAIPLMVTSFRSESDARSWISEKMKAEAKRPGADRPDDTNQLAKFIVDAVTRDDDAS